jgi:hypothetical protein
MRFIELYNKFKKITKKTLLTFEELRVCDYPDIRSDSLTETQMG